MALVPQLEYPANPPSIGEAETIGVRGPRLRFEMVLIALAALALAVLLRRRLLARLRRMERSARGHAGISSPSSRRSSSRWPMSNEVPENFQAIIVLWRFQIASFGTQLTLWAWLRVIFAVLAERALSGRRGPARN